MTPPMGWNSWDCYGTTVTEEEVLANAAFMAEHLLPYGWDTVVVDIQWYEPAARAGGYNDDAALELDGFGRQLPAVNRFPSATGGRGFAPLAERIHGMGLKFGLHVMRGIPRQAVRDTLPVEGTDATADQIADTSSTCEWNTDNFGLNHRHPGAQAYYDSQLRLFASWGVDFVKADDMLGPYFDAEIAAYRSAMDRCGRDMVLSLSPSSAPCSRSVASPGPHSCSAATFRPRLRRPWTSRSPTAGRCGRPGAVPVPESLLLTACVSVCPVPGTRQHRRKPRAPVSPG